jgi:hypothetical protein
VNRLKPILSFPNWARRPISAVILGITIPVTICVTIALLAYYPVGSALPRSSFLNVIGIALAIAAAAAIIPVAAAAWSLLAWNWRPLLYSLLVIVGIVLGIGPGFWLHTNLRQYALHLFVSRSEELVRAIHHFEQVRRRAPTSIGELVPIFLPTVPPTGMAEYPAYRYQSGPGPCSDQNRWHLTVPTEEFIVIAYMLYCPEHDYAKAKLNDLPEQVGGWGYVSYYR